MLAEIIYMVAAKSLQLCPTLCDPIDGSPPGSPVPGILQARTLEWVAIPFSNAWKWKWSRSVMSDSSWPYGLQPTRLLCPWDFPGKSTGVGCHCLLRFTWLFFFKYSKASYLLKSLYFSIYGSHCHFQLWHSLSIRSYFNIDLLPTKLGLAPYHIFL